MNLVMALFDKKASLVSFLERDVSTYYSLVLTFFRDKSCIGYRCVRVYSYVYHQSSVFLAYARGSLSSLVATHFHFRR